MIRIEIKIKGSKITYSEDKNSTDYSKLTNGKDGNDRIINYVKAATEALVKAIKDVKK